MIRAAAAWVLLCGALAPARAADRSDAAPVQLGVIVDSTDAPSLGPRLRAALRLALERDPGVAPRPLDVGAVHETGPLSVADGAIGKAEALFQDMDLDPARAALDEAIRTYEEHLVELAQRETGVRPLRDAHVLLAKVYFFGGAFDSAKDALRRAFVLDPKLGFTTQLFPPQMKRIVVEARLLYETLGGGKIEVTSEPTGAEVILNGHRASPHTPAVVDAPPGPSSVEVVLPGYASLRRIVDVGAAGARGDPRVAFTLRRDDAPAARARAAAVALAAGGKAEEDLPALAGHLGVDALLVVHAAAITELRWKVTAGAYHLEPRGKPDAKPGASVDAKPSARLDAREERSGLNASLESELEALLRPILDKIHEHHKPIVVAERGGEGRLRRFRKSKAFWWVVGGVSGALAVGIGVGAGVGASEAHRHAIARDAVLLGASR